MDRVAFFFDIVWSFLRLLSQLKVVNRKVQEEPQAEVAANPCHQEEGKK